MFNLDLLKKSDLVWILDGFETAFYQKLVKQSSKILTPYIQNGFRPEKLTRTQLLNTFTDALWARVPGVTGFILENLEINYKDLGIDAYVQEKKSMNYPVDACIIDLTRMTFEKGMGEPAHIVLMLYGIECTDEQKERSESLYRALIERCKEVSKKSYDEGYAKGGEGFANDLEAERKKTAKLQKSLDAASQRAKKDEEEIKKQKADYQKLLSESEKIKQKLSELETNLYQTQNDLSAMQELDRRQKELIADLGEKLGHAWDSIQTSRDQIASLTAELEEKIAITPDELKNVCLDAIRRLHSKGQDRDQVLTLAKQKFTETDDVKAAWKRLCDDSLQIVSELFDQLANNTFAASLFDRFAELENLLLLENAIKQSLCLVAHKIMASGAENDASYGNFTVEE